MFQTQHGQGTLDIGQVRLTRAVTGTTCVAHLSRGLALRSALAMHQERRQKLKHMRHADFAGEAVVS